MEEHCDHMDEDGFSTLVFPKRSKVFGLRDYKIKCFCKKCKKTIQISRKEYEDIIKEGSH